MRHSCRNLALRALIRSASGGGFANLDEVIRFRLRRGNDQMRKFSLNLIRMSAWEQPHGFKTPCSTTLARVRRAAGLTRPITEWLPGSPLPPSRGRFVAGCPGVKSQPEYSVPLLPMLTRALLWGGGAFERPPPPSSFSRLAKIRRRAAPPGFHPPYPPSFPLCKNFDPMPCEVRSPGQVK